MHEMATTPQSPIAGERKELMQVHFGGKIILVENHDEVAEAMNALHGEKLLGFDMEWKPNGEGQDNPIALIQLASSTVCVLFRMLKLGFMPTKLRNLLVNRHVCKVGHTVDDSDALKLQQQYGVTCCNIIDVKEISREMGFFPLSLKALTADILGYYLDKTLAVSNWDFDQLTEEQKIYAATDAWVTREVFLQLTPLMSPCMECQTCFKQFRTKKALAQHLRDKNHFDRTRRKLSWSDVIAEKFNVPCNTATVVPISNTYTTSAYMAYGSTFYSPCFVCGKEFKNKKALSQHLRDTNHRRDLNGVAIPDSPLMPHGGSGGNEEDSFSEDSFSDLSLGSLSFDDLSAVSSDENASFEDLAYGIASSTLESYPQRNESNPSFALYSPFSLDQPAWNSSVEDSSIKMWSNILV